MKIIAPTHGEAAYSRAVSAFFELWQKITGEGPEIVTEDNGNGDDIDPIHDLYLKPLKVPFLFSWQHFLREAACFFL